MKKSLLTISMLALLVVANAQDDKKTPVEKKPAKKEVVNADGTTSVLEEKATPAPVVKEEPKKAGTRMAINEKGTATVKQSTNKDNAKEAKTETAPTSKPH